MDVGIVHGADHAYVKGEAGHALVKNERDLIDLIGFCGEHHADRVLLFAENLPEKFFELSSGEAGMVLQKFANYRVKVAAVLPASLVRGKFGEFVCETNRGGQFRVFQSPDQAVQWLAAD
ncbi:MAG: hypothetical protein A2X66_08905 [Ignavibacteria bacterium GWA2_54_16]|nr:MAG: hypothetical protein A2X66_08905 [Ignavibacteria bacterium GWA2_54_16]